MSTFKWTLDLVVIFALIGSSFCAQDGGDVQSQTITDYEVSITGHKDTCPIEILNLNENQRDRRTHRSISRCFETLPSILHYSQPGAEMEQFRAYSRDFCRTVPTVIECLDDEPLTLMRCQNNTKSVWLNVVYDMAKTSMENGCVSDLGDGERLAIILFGVTRHVHRSDPEKWGLQKCVWDAIIKFWLVPNSVDTATKIWYFHRGFIGFKQCFVGMVDGDELFKTVIGDHFNEMVDKMKCLHPRDMVLVRCKSIANRLLNKVGLCPLNKVNASSKEPMGLSMENHAGLCFDLAWSERAGIVNVDSYRGKFKAFCAFGDAVKFCLDLSTWVGELCLENSELVVFKGIVNNYLKVGFNVGCWHHGQRLATVFDNAVTSSNNSTGEDDALVTCYNVARASRDLDYGDRTRLHRYYQELQVMRDCILARINGDGVFVEETTSFFNNFMERMKCFHPEDGTIVRCANIVLN